MIDEYTQSDSATQPPPVFRLTVVAVASLAGPRDCRVHPILKLSQRDPAVLIFVDRRHEPEAASAKTQSKSLTRA